MLVYYIKINIYYVPISNSRKKDCSDKSPSIKIYLKKLFVFYIKYCLK